MDDMTTFYNKDRKPSNEMVLLVQQHIARHDVSVFLLGIASLLDLCSRFGHSRHCTKLDVCIMHDSLIT